MADIFRGRAERLGATPDPMRAHEVFRTTDNQGAVIVALKPDELSVLRRYWAAKGDPLLGDAPRAREDAA